MGVYEFQFMFDWGSGTCLWSINDLAKRKYGYDVNIDVLPISKELKGLANSLIMKHDEALDWSNPGGDLLWDETEILMFKKQAKELYCKLCDELGTLYSIQLKEDFMM